MNIQNDPHFLIDQSALRVIMEFGTKLSCAQNSGEILGHLTEAAHLFLQADAMAIWEIDPKAEFKLIRQINLPEALEKANFEAGLLGPELERKIHQLTDGQFSQVSSFPLIHNHDIFGVLIVLFKNALSGIREYQEGKFPLLESLIHLAALALSHVGRESKLHQICDQLDVSKEILQRTEKLRTLGQMSAGISHDLKNFLTPLVLEAQLLKRLLQSSDSHAEKIMQIVERFQDNLKRGLDITERLRDFSRQSPSQVEPHSLVVTDLNKLIEEALEICRPRIPLQVDFQVFLSPLPQLKIQPSEFVASLVNMIVNSLDALNGRGQITLESGHDEDEKDRSVWVKLSDNGPGMSEEVKRRIFEPFFTTKGQEGTGLGLATAFSFMQRHGGKLLVDSALGRGTQFTLRFFLD